MPRAAVFAHAPHPLVLADAAAAAVFAPAPLLLVLTQDLALGSLHGCSKMDHRSCGLDSCAGCAASTPLLLTTLSLTPRFLCMFIRLSRLARSGSLLAILAAAAAAAAVLSGAA